MTSVTFSRGWAARQGGDQCVSLVFARGDTTAPSGLYARLCHAFLGLSYFSNNKSDALKRAFMHSLVFKI